MVAVHRGPGLGTPIRVGSLTPGTCSTTASGRGPARTNRSSGWPTRSSPPCATDAPRARTALVDRLFDGLEVGLGLFGGGGRGISRNCPGPPDLAHRQGQACPRLSTWRQLRRVPHRLAGWRYQFLPVRRTPWSGMDEMVRQGRVAAAPGDGAPSGRRDAPLAAPRPERSGYLWRQCRAR